MKTIEQTERAKIRYTKTWGYEVIKKNELEDHSGNKTRGLMKSFGKTDRDKKEAFKYYESIK